jgi:glycosyltransferase involved in cell wall biosynthesis
VRLVPWLDEKDLPALYCAASAMVFPSLYEGGGIPVLEAMACGCPVVASDIPAIREYGDDAVTFIDPFSVSSIAAALRHVQDDESTTRETVRKGFEAAARRRPEIIAQMLAAAYRSSAERGTRTE